MNLEKNIKIYLLFIVFFKKNGIKLMNDNV